MKLKFLQITSAFGIVNSILLFKTSPKRFIINSLLTASSLIVHRNYPAKTDETVRVVDKVLAFSLALSNYYYGCTNYDNYLSIGEHNIFAFMCLSSYLYVRRTSSKIAHSMVHFCWHSTTYLVVHDLTKKKITNHN